MKKKKKKTIRLTIRLWAQRRIKRRQNRLTIRLSAQRRRRWRRRQFTWQSHSQHRGGWEEGGTEKRRQFIRQPHSQHNLLPWISFLSLPEASQKATARAASFLSWNNHCNHSWPKRRRTVHHISSTNYYGWSTQLLPADPLAIAASRSGTPPSSTVASRPRDQRTASSPFTEIRSSDYRQGGQPTGLSPPPPSPNYPAQN